jgi:hypothetical protein
MTKTVSVRLVATFPAFVFAVGCSSNGGSVADGGGDSCGSIAACYQVAVVSAPNAPADCTKVMADGVYDYSVLTSDGMYSGQNIVGSWTGQLSSCTLSGTFSGTPSTFRYTFAPSGFSGTWLTCVDDAGAMSNATVSGTRLPSCPMSASSSGVEDASPDSTMSGSASGGSSSETSDDGGGEATELGDDGSTE